MVTHITIIINGVKLTKPRDYAKLENKHYNVTSNNSIVVFFHMILNRLLTKNHHSKQIISQDRLIKI